jgi:hypothetical protein
MVGRGTQQQRVPPATVETQKRLYVLLHNKTYEGAALPAAH